MPVEINEPVSVGAIFASGTVRPVWFSWKGRQVRIRETAYIWHTSEGSARVLHYSVSDGQGLYELCYNTASLGWWIARAEGGE